MSGRGLDVGDDALDPAVEASAQAFVEVGGGEPQAGILGDRRPHAGFVGPRSRRASGGFRGLRAGDREESSVVAARISATGAVAGRKTAAMAPRRRPMPSEKKRVIWSAPTNDCQ